MPTYTDKRHHFFHEHDAIKKFNLDAQKKQSITIVLIKISKTFSDDFRRKLLLLVFFRTLVFCNCKPTNNKLSLLHSLTICKIQHRRNRLLFVRDLYLIDIQKFNQEFHTLIIGLDTVSWVFLGVRHKKVATYILIKWH